MFDNEFASSSAFLPGDEFLILQSHGCRALVAGYFFEPKLHENGFKDADPPRLSVLDNVDLIRERLVDEFDSPFDCAFILAFRIAALALLPLRIFRRPLVADRGRSLAVSHSSDLLTSSEADASTPPSARSALNSAKVFPDAWRACRPVIFSQRAIVVST